MIIPPLPVKWVVFLFGLVAFPVFLGGLVWPCPLPALWSGACGPFGWPRPACYRGMVWLLPLVSSNFILRALSPPPLWWGLWSFLVGPALYRGMVWLLPLVSSDVIVTCSLPYHKI